VPVQSRFDATPERAPALHVAYKRFIVARSRGDGQQCFDNSRQDLASHAVGDRGGIRAALPSQKVYATIQAFLQII
jgi:hypothetical protein